MALCKRGMERDEGARGERERTPRRRGPILAGSRTTGEGVFEVSLAGREHVSNEAHLVPDNLAVVERDAECERTQEGR